MDYDTPLIKDADPELERLLAEEDAIQAGTMLERKQYELLFHLNTYSIIERVTNGSFMLFHDFGTNGKAAETCLKALRIASTFK